MIQSTQNNAKQTVCILYGIYCKHVALGYCWIHRKSRTRRMRTSQLQLASHLSARDKLEPPAPNKCIWFKKIWQELRGHYVDVFPSNIFNWLIYSFEYHCEMSGNLWVV